MANNPKWFDEKDMPESVEYGAELLNHLVEKFHKNTKLWSKIARAFPVAPKDSKNAYKKHG